MAFLPRTISRRGLLRGTAVAGAGTIAVSALAACSGKKDDEDSNKDPVVVDSGTATYVVGSGDIAGAYEEATDEKGTTSLASDGSWNISLGCVLRPAEGNLKPYVAPGTAASPMAVAGVFSIATGKTAELVDDARGGANYVVFDARCSDTVFAWSELNTVTREWCLFAAPLAEGGGLGTVSQLWKADANYDPPRFVCSGSSVIWLVMPATSGSRTTENSSCYLWQVGGSSADEVVRSQGRFACPPSVSDGMVTLAPRVRVSEGRYYGITSYALSTGMASSEAQLVLPQSVQPLYATRMGDKFAFSIEANYGSSYGLLGNMGTYIGNGDDPFVVLPREPAAEVSGKDGIYLIKTRASHLIVDTNAQTYATLAAPNRALDYGDYPASSGTTSTFVTFATVKDVETGYPSSVAVRAWSMP